MEGDDEKYDKLMTDSILQIIGPSILSRHRDGCKECVRKRCERCHESKPCNQFDNYSPEFMELNISHKKWLQDELYHIQLYWDYGSMDTGLKMESEMINDILDILDKEKVHLSAEQLTWMRNYLTLDEQPIAQDILEALEELCRRKECKSCCKT